MAFNNQGFYQRAPPAFEEKFGLPESEIEVSVVARETNRHNDTYMIIRNPNKSQYLVLDFLEFKNLVGNKKIICNSFKKGIEVLDKLSGKRKRKSLTILPKASETAVEEEISGKKVKKEEESEEDEEEIVSEEESNYINSKSLNLEEQKLIEKIVQPSQNGTQN